MRIENRLTNEEWEDVVLHLTRMEASELRDALETLLESQSGQRHEHVPDQAFGKEITVVLTD